MKNTANKLLLVDAFSLIYRAFFAIRMLNAPDGTPVNALYGFTKMVRKLLATHAPSHGAVVFDCGPPRRRLSVLPTYKEQRPPTPPELEAQLGGIREVLQAMRLFVAEMEGEEADDIIATLAVRAAAMRFDVLVASQDKDFCQIVGSRIRLLRPDREEMLSLGPEDVRARYGVGPEQFVDYLSLVGDAVDNIAGVPGVGPKTAANLLREHGSLEKLLERPERIRQPKLRRAIVEAAKQLRVNQGLLRLETDLAVPWSLDELRIVPADEPRLRELFARYGFRSLLAEKAPTRGNTELLLDL
ncbi:MAG: 5'-3' exonuclease [Verrucomicrobiae bacterium]|nr:5'-3' exonuclease [Verrucomicrobiae bacterium]